METGYYWYRCKAYVHGQTIFKGPWAVCSVRQVYRDDHPGFVDFFGEHSQLLNSDYIKKYVEFGEKIVEPS